MRTLTWGAGCFVIGLAALFYRPGISLGIDCSYGGAFNPPLADVNPVDQFCETQGSVKALGTVGVGGLFNLNTPPLEFLGATTLRISQEQPIQAPGSPSLPQGSFGVLGGIVETFIIPHVGSTGPILIDATGEIRNLNGIMYLTAPLDQLRLKAALSIFLQGPNFGSPIVFPSTLLQGDPVKLQSDKGSIVVENAAIVALQQIVDFVAPRGNVSIHNSVIFAFEDGGTTVGICRFQVNKIIGQVIGLNDPTNFFVCLPQVIKK